MRKLMWFVIGVALAAAVGCYLLAPESYFYAAGMAALLLAASLTLMLRFPKVRIVAITALGCVLGLLWQMGFEWLYLSTPRAADTEHLTLTIYASDYSYATDYGAAVDGIVELNGKPYAVRTYLPKDTEVSPGDVVTGIFELRCTLPGSAKESDYYRSGAMFLIAYPKGGLSVREAEKIPWYGIPAYIRSEITHRIQMIFSEDAVGFAQALLLGDTDGIDHETDTALKRSGIRHIVAVSGLHVTILFSLVSFLMGRKKWLTALIGLPVLFLFAAVAGFSPSITRACIMHALMVVAMLFEREYDPPTALSFAVLVMLLCNPWTVTHVGFQLSVGCMIGISLFSDRIQRWLMASKRLGRFRGIRHKLAAIFSASVSISISASILTVPLSAWYFGMVSLMGPVTNLLTLWIVTYVFIGIILACAVSLLWLPLGSIFAWVTAWGIRYVLLMAKALSAFPLTAVYTQSVYIVMWLVVCYVLLAAFMMMKRKRPLLLGAYGIITLCIALIASWTEPLLDECRVTVLDVGQGQCILLQSQGKNFMVDCGGSSDTLAADEAAGLLRSQGISRLDGVILTHYDRDHAGGVSYLLSQVDTDALYLPTCQDKEGISDTLKAYSDGQVLTVCEDVSIAFGSANITLIPSQSSISDNESGLCVLFQTENCDILITGDRSAEGERELLNSRTLPDLEVLIVGHHGSKTSTSRELLLKTQPDIAIISVGADNSYGHPAQDILERLEKYGCVIYRTDLHGTVIYRG